MKSRARICTLYHVFPQAQLAGEVKDFRLPFGFHFGKFFGGPHIMIASWAAATTRTNPATMVYGIAILDSLTSSPAVALVGIPS